MLPFKLVYHERYDLNLGPGDDFFMFGESRKLFEMFWRDLLRFVRVNANSGVYPIVLLGERNGRIQLFGTWARADREQGGDPSRAGALEHGFAVLRELREVDVRV